MPPASSPAKATSVACGWKPPCCTSASRRRTWSPAISNGQRPSSACTHSQGMPSRWLWFPAEHSVSLAGPTRSVGSLVCCLLEPIRVLAVKSPSLAFWRLQIGRPLLAAVALIALFTGGVQAQTLVATSNIIVRALDRTFDFTSDTTTSIRDSKIVLAARDDAASFVASQGAIRGAQLEAALGTIRSRVPEAQQASDQVLAEAILAR